MKTETKSNTEPQAGINLLLAAGAPETQTKHGHKGLGSALDSRGLCVGATSEDCPSNEFLEGNPNGKCWGDGHYRCKNCKNYREDFKRLGQDYIDFAHQIQSTVQIQNVKII
jgi:hypothetical protein